MTKVTIFKYIRSPHDHSKITGKETLRVINVHDSFIGIGKHGSINMAEFKELADDLESHNDGVSLS